MLRGGLVELVVLFSGDAWVCVGWSVCWLPVVRGVGCVVGI